MRFENVSVLVESILDVIKEVRYCWYVLSSSLYNYFRNYLSFSLCETSSKVPQKNDQKSKDASFQ